MNDHWFQEPLRRSVSADDALYPLGGGQAIMIDHRRGILIGATDSRRDGIVLGY